LAKLLPLDQYGYFSLAVAIATALSVVVGPIHNAAFPRLSELAVGSDLQVLAREYHRFAQLMSMALLPPALVLAVFAQEIVQLWTGDPVTAREVAPLVTVWALGTALNGVMHIPYAAQLAHGWARLTMIVNAIAVALLLPATLYWVPRYGAIAAAWIWVSINAGYAILSIAVMHGRILKAEKWRWYLQDLAAPLLPAAVGVTGCVLFRRHLGVLGAGGEVAFLACSLGLTCLCVFSALPAGQAFLRSVLTRSPLRLQHHDHT
jgi:O-antigen/teichoic acid export membrane protein